ncbi:MAG: tetratricopeptide repeat protein [Candidatus Sumerlaeaceae bacterium]|nr:tetratricopeptide repeat protein [Candidatus Sumerlaeaceae bacterium]
MSPAGHDEIMERYKAAQHLMGMHRYVEAARYLDDCLEKCEMAGDTTSCESLLGELAVCYQKATQVEDSIVALNRLLAFVSARGPSSEWAIVHHNLGILHDQQRDWDKAELHFRRSTQISAEAGDRRGRALSLSMLGQMLFRLGRLHESVDCLLGAVEILFQEDAAEFGEVASFAGRIARETHGPQFGILARNVITDPMALKAFLKNQNGS